MTQIEIIKKEIERRTYNAHEMSDSCPNKQFYEGKDVAYGEILSLIESLEQKSQCDGCVNDKGCVTCVDGNMKETQPKGLDEAAEEYARQYTKNDNGNGGDDWEDDIRITFEAGAKWMAEQGVRFYFDESTKWSEVTNFVMENCKGRVIVQIRKI